MPLELGHTRHTASPRGAVWMALLGCPRLLLQPEGFEGFGMVEIVSLPNDLAALDGVDVADREVSVDAARSPANLPVHTGDDVVAGAEQLSKNRRVFTFPGLLQTLKEVT